MKHTQRRIPRVGLVEGLESRCLLAASVEVVEGVLTIRGDANVTNRIRVTARPRAGTLMAAAGKLRQAVPLAGVIAVSVVGGNANDKLLLGKSLNLPATLDAGAGNDKLAGGAGNDLLLGGPGNDVLVGRRGDDRLIGGGGKDKYSGGPGATTIDNSDPSAQLSPVDPAPQPQPGPDPQPVPEPQPPPPPPGPIQPPYPTTVSARPTSLQRPDGSVFTLGRDVKQYRNSDGLLVVGDGVHDDTTGIQRAIDLLPRSQGVPQGTIPVGGTIYLPAGVYRITQALRVPGGVVLQGAGPDSIIQYDGDRAAVEYVNEGAGIAAAAGAADLTVRSARGGGFAVKAGVHLVLMQMRFRDLVLDTAGWGIDFRSNDSYTQNSFFDNLLIKSVGAGGIAFNGNANKVNAVRAEGAPRDGFSSARGVVVIDGGGTSVTNSVLADLPAGALGFRLRGGDASGLAWFTNNSVVPAGSAAPAAGDTAGFLFENLEALYIDDLGGRKAHFVNAKGVRIARAWADGDGASLAQAYEMDGGSRVLIDDVYSTQPMVSPNRDNAPFHVSRWHQGTVDEYLAARGDVAAKLPASPTVARPAIAIGVNVLEFTGDTGFPVKGDGVNDDTAGIQKAINVFLSNRDNPAAPQSGAVYLPTGLYKISQPLTVPSGVVLVGDGSGSAIKYVGAGGVAVRFSDPSGTVTGAGVENLSISAENGGGVGDVRGVPVVGARLSDLVLQVSGWGIDLRDLRDGRLENVHQKRLGAGAVRLEARNTLVSAVNSEFGVRDGFNADPAILVVKGDGNTITGNVIEGVPSGSAHGIYVSGTGVIYGNNWVELIGGGKPMAGKDGVGVIFENLRDARIHEVFGLTSAQRAKFINSQAIFTILDTNAEQWPLTTTVLLDEASRLNVEFAISRYGLGDPGPRVTVAEQLVLSPGGAATGGVWSPRAGYGAD
jgi:hypothetical protein